VPAPIDLMTSDKEAPGGFSLRRWSRRKLAASRETLQDANPRPEPPAAAAGSSPPTAPSPAPKAKSPALPSIDSLTTESDFAPFMRADVDASLQHKALRKLFDDPRFNVMDGLDVYVDDYSKPDPIAPDVVARLAQARYLFDPPVTRVDETGVVVDVPPPPPADAVQADALPAAASGVEAVPAAPGAPGAPAETRDAVPAPGSEAAPGTEAVPDLLARR
jgi:hypothetical protein